MDTVVTGVNYEASLPNCRRAPWRGRLGNSSETAAAESAIEAPKVPPLLSTERPTAPKVWGRAGSGLGPSPPSSRQEVLIAVCLTNQVIKTVLYWIEVRFMGYTSRCIAKKAE